jgi:hypothetical protein
MEILIYILATYGTVIICAVCYRTILEIFTTKNYIQNLVRDKMEFRSKIHWESENRLFAGNAYLGRVLPRYIAPSFIYGTDGTWDESCWRYCTGAVNAKWVGGFPTVEAAREALVAAVLSKSAD